MERILQNEFYFAYNFSIFLFLFFAFFFFFFLLTIFFTNFFSSESTKITKQQNKLMNWHINRGNQQCVCLYLVIHKHLAVFYLLFVCLMANFGPSSRWQILTGVSHCMLYILTRTSLKLPEIFLLKTGTISQYDKWLQWDSNSQPLGS